MQLKPKTRKRAIVSSLAAATCSLLASAAPSHGAGSGSSSSERKWSFDTAIHYYGETDRVQDSSADFVVNRLFEGDRRLTMRLGFDSLTGSSGSGALPATTAQTFTSPSGKRSYTTPAGEMPLDPTFLDTRVALSANWDQPFKERMRIGGGISLSKEYDYLHTGVNGRFAIDFNQRTTTLNVGLSVANDTIDPEGEIPIGLSPMLGVGDLSNRIGDDSKRVTDLLIGVSQVLGKRTVGQLNYSFSTSSGYLNDPYKIISVVDPVTGNPTAGSGTPNLYRYDSRPDSRVRQALFGQVRHKFKRDILNASYRYMTDDWGIESHTVDLRYRFKLGQRNYLQPHLRYYTQTEADFYSAVLFDGDPLPQHASADYRIGDLDGITFGLKYGWLTAGDSEWSVRAEFYQQTGRAPPGASVGALAALDLDTSVDAVIFQVGYRF